MIPAEYKSDPDELVAWRRRTMLRMIVAAAEDGRVCPSNEEFGIALGGIARASVWKYLTALEGDRRIKVTGRGRDRVVRVVLTGKETMPQSDMRAQQAILAAAAIWQISAVNIAGGSRLKEFIRPRFAASLVASEMGATLSKIGRVLGGRDHSTIVHSVDQAREMEKRDPVFAARIARLRTDCKLLAA